MLTVFYLSIIMITLFISVLNSSSPHLATKVKEKLNTSSKVLFSDLPRTSTSEERAPEDHEKEAMLSI